MTTPYASNATFDQAANRPFYPVFISLYGCHCTLVGLGNVGRRKLAGLLENGATSILALDTRPREALDPCVEVLLSRPGIVYANRACNREDIKNSILVFAATDRPEENSRIAQICREENTLCNCATRPQEGGFILPAMAKKDSLCIAISTGGGSPAMAAILRRELDLWLAAKSRLVWLMARLRPFLPHGDGSSRSPQLEKLLSPQFASWLENGEISSCRQWLAQELPHIPKESLDKIFLEYANVFS